MLCQACGKNTATTHVKTIVNGELAEYSLCAECAQKMGYGNLLSNFGFNFGSLLGSFFWGKRRSRYQHGTLPGLRILL